MSPFNPERARQQRRQRSMESYGQWPVRAARLHQHCGCLAPRPPPGSPVTAGHTPNPLWAPVLGESPPVPREEAELGGCHQVGLPGPGLDRGFLCGGNRDVCHAENRPQVETSGEDKRWQRARSQGFAFWEELGQLLGKASYKQTPGGPTNGAGTQYRRSGRDSRRGQPSPRPKRGTGVPRSSAAAGRNEAS